jgi:hypothetical protein
MASAQRTLGMSKAQEWKLESAQHPAIPAHEPACPLAVAILREHEMIDFALGDQESKDSRTPISSNRRTGR